MIRQAHSMIWVILTAVFVIWGSDALAQTPKAETKATKAGNFNELDKNGDGKVSKEEFRAFLDNQFSEMKKDKDGNVTVESYTVYMAARFKSLDKNNDGVITPDEYETANIDANKDGKVTLDEWNALVVRRIKITDTDNDGKITPKEYDVFTNVYFKVADKNGDGFVVKEEWAQNAPEAQQTKGKDKKN